MTRPEIVFLDEPFSALDPPTREALTGDLERILRETQTTAVASTHDQTEALRLADRIAVVNGGRIAQIGPVAEVMNRPVDEFVASFVGVETILPGRVVRVSDGVFVAAVEGGEIQAVGHVRTGEGVLCCIRPEHVTLSTNTPFSESSARNVFAGTIRKITPLGLFNRIHLDCGFELVGLRDAPVPRRAGVWRKGRESPPPSKRRRSTSSPAGTVPPRNHSFRSCFICFGFH